MLVSGPWIARIAGAGAAAHAGRLRRPQHRHVRQEAAQETERLAAAGVDHIKAHAGLTLRRLQGDRRRRPPAPASRSTRTSTPRPDVRNALEAGVDVLQHVGSAGTAPPYSKELITDIVNAGRPVVVTAAHRAGCTRTPRRFPERLQDPELKKAFRPDDLRRGAGLAEELAGARLLPAHRPRDAVPRARREAVHRVGRGDGHGHRLAARR